MKKWYKKNEKKSLPYQSHKTECVNYREIALLIAYKSVLFITSLCNYLCKIMET